MNRAILSLCLLHPNDSISKEEQLQHYSTLADLVNNLYNYFDFSFEYYIKAPYAGYKMDIPCYKDNPMLNNLVTTNIFAVLQRMLVKGYVDLEYITPATCLTPITIPEVDAKDAFLRYINYVKNDAVLFVGKDNLKVERPFQFFAEDNFEVNVSHAAFVELSDVLVRYLKVDNDFDKIFPADGVCKKYNEYVKNKVADEKLNQSQKMALYELVGDIVAKYNFYQKDARLSTLNTTKKKKRIVYTRLEKVSYYLSLDLESGGFEVFNHNRIHMGQYDFSCRIVKKPSPKTHKLVV